MITVLLGNILLKDGKPVVKDPENFSVTVSGHSRKEKKGKDILCAAVSAVSQTAVLMLEKTDGLTQTVEQKDGFLKTVCKITEESNNRTEIILEFFLTGITELAVLEPEEIRIRFV